MAFSFDQLELSRMELCHITGIPMTTLRRILTSLTENRFLEKNRAGKYVIGPQFYIYGSLYLHSTDFVKAAQPVMKTLNDLTSESVSLGTLNGASVNVIMREESKHAVRFSYNIGSLLPAYAASIGKALLSELSPMEIDRLYPQQRLIPWTAKTVNTKAELKLELEQIRNDGVAFDREGTFEGFEGIASVIRNERGIAIAGLGIAGAISRIRQAQEDRLSQLVKLSVSLISYRLGYHDNNMLVRDISEIYSLWNKNMNTHL
jgi:DNA-binding IclR family transcriptional regulator